MCLDRAPRNRAGSGPDRSRADYVWCMVAISWGHGVDETAARLMQESRKARRKAKATLYRPPARLLPPSNAGGSSNRCDIAPSSTALIAVIPARARACAA